MLSLSRLLTGRVEPGDAVRYDRQSRQLPAHLLHYSRDKKPVVVWTATRRCNLHCAHCYTDSQDIPYPNELTPREAMNMVGQLADFGAPVLLISGGEPLRRPDVEVIAAYAISRGMRVVLSTNGTLIDADTARRFAAIGLSYVGISIDGPPQVHDRFRGAPGAFERSMAALEACRQAGLKTGLRFTLTRQNLAHLPWLFDLMEERNIGRLCIYHLAPTGRGARLREFTPSHEETRGALDYVCDRVEDMAARGFETEVLTADNHADAAFLWQRISRDRPDQAPAAWQLLAWNGGNRSGEAIAAIDADGTVYPDQFWRWQPLGNVRNREFGDIWRDNPPPLLEELRTRGSRLPERCQSCQYLPICNGNFRSRAEAVTGDRWGQDPLCYLTPAEVSGAVN